MAAKTRNMHITVKLLISIILISEKNVPFANQQC